MRPRAPLAAAAALVALPLAACGTQPPAPRTQGAGGPSAARTAGATTATPSTASPSVAPAASATPTPAGPTCAEVVAAMTPDERAGQLFMMGHAAGEPVDSATRALVAQTHTGQVILLEDTRAGRDGVRRLADALRSAAPAPGGVRVLVAADQEGGRVQRLAGDGFSAMPSAADQAKLPAADLEAAAERWGRELRQAGIDVDLAPVADTVPSEVGDANDPIGALDRAYGSTPDEVAPRVEAFVRGMRAAGVVTSVKHFPNLGRVRGNTDLASGVSDPTTTRDDPALAPFRRGVAAGADMVMVSTAAYARIDPGVPAAFSPVVVGDVLRGGLGFDGVVISDDLGAAKQVASVPPAERGVRVVAAGGDVVINGDPSIHRAMVDGVRRRQAADPAFAAKVTRSAERVVAMKSRHGAATCRA